MSALFSSASAKWRTIAIFTLAFWFSSSLILDFVIMPGLYATGMLHDPSFAIAGYSIFWLFNRVELLCASLVLTSVLVLWQSPAREHISHRTVAIAAFLLAIPLLHTYLCTPVMSELGVTLDWFAQGTEIPDGMTQMHSIYFGLELAKLTLAGGLLRSLYGDRILWSEQEPTSKVAQ